MEYIHELEQLAQKMRDGTITPAESTILQKLYLQFLKEVDEAITIDMLRNKLKA